jgi:target of rapamycin complex 2 subunit MAPKAP1
VNGNNNDDNSSATMYMQEALEMVCRRRRLQAKEYALLLSDLSILIPLDRTVASLQGKSDLRLVKRSMLPQMNVDVRPIGRSTDPNGASLLAFFCREQNRNDSPTMTLLSSSLLSSLASIFKRMSDVPDLDYNTSQDFTAAYRVSQPRPDLTLFG